MDEKPFPNKETRDSCLFGILHADLIGPMTPEARWSHTRFCLAINDDHSGFSFTFDHRHKNDMVEAIIDLEKSIETKFQKHVHTLKTNNRGEFINDVLTNHCQSRGITIVTSIPHSPEQNGQVERRNRVIVEGTCKIFTLINVLTNHKRTLTRYI